MGYSHRALNADTDMILDPYRDALYLIRGKDFAILLDTGMDKEPLRPIACQLAGQEVRAVLTHGHIDHIGRTGDFKTAWINPADIPLYRDHMNVNFRGTEPATLSFLAPEHLQALTGDIDLGDRLIRIVPLPGHTPGSTLFVDANHKTVYTGDAIGSGKGVWMQIPGSLPVRAYEENLRAAIDALRQLGVTNEWKFYSGHDGQESMSRVSPYNRLDLQLMEDMATLCGRLTAGTAALEPADVLCAPGEQPFYTCFGKAEMFVTKTNIDRLS